MAVTERIVPVIRDERRRVAVCDNCAGEADFDLYTHITNALPEWVELNVYDPLAEEYLEKHFCGLTCLVEWGTQRLAQSVA